MRETDKADMPSLVEAARAHLKQAERMRARAEQRETVKVGEWATLWARSKNLRAALACHEQEREAVTELIQHAETVLLLDKSRHKGVALERKFNRQYLRAALARCREVGL